MIWRGVDPIAPKRAIVRRWVDDPHRCRAGDDDCCHDEHEHAERGDERTEHPVEREEVTARVEPRFGAGDPRHACRSLTFDERIGGGRIVETEVAHCVRRGRRRRSGRNRPR